MELDITQFLNKKVRVEWKTPYGKPTKRKEVGELSQGKGGRLHLHVDGGFYYIIGVEDIISMKVVK